jgi:hypothetical protein
MAADISRSSSRELRPDKTALLIHENEGIEMTRWVVRSTNAAGWSVAG